MTESTTLSRQIEALSEQLSRVMAAISEIRVAVGSREAYCAEAHRRVDERAAEDRARIIALEAAAKLSEQQASWAKGAGWALAKVAAVAGGGGAAAAAALKLLGG
jgi:hypothetical protein